MGYDVLGDHETRTHVKQVPETDRSFRIVPSRWGVQRFAVVVDDFAEFQHFLVHVCGSSEAPGFGKRSLRRSGGEITQIFCDCNLNCGFSEYAIRDLNTDSTAE